MSDFVWWCRIPVRREWTPREAVGEARRMMRRIVSSGRGADFAIGCASYQLLAADWGVEEVPLTLSSEDSPEWRELFDRPRPPEAEFTRLASALFHERLAKDELAERASKHDEHRELLRLRAESLREHREMLAWEDARDAESTERHGEEQEFAEFKLKTEGKTPWTPEGKKPCPDCRSLGHMHRRDCTRSP